jgi:hypothetical protein
LRHPAGGRKVDAMHTVMAALLLTVRLYSVVALPDADRQTATRVAAGILKSAQVDVRWLDCRERPARGQEVADCLTPPGPDSVIVRFVTATSRPSGLVHGDTLGDAYVDTVAAAGSLATVYADRATAMAKSAGVDAGTLMGRVAAHEIAHLLIGTSTHPPTGLMRAQWSTAQLQRGALRDWQLSRADAARVRTGMLRRTAHGPLASDRQAAVALPCRAVGDGPAPLVCPSCPICATVLPANRAPFELLVEPRL